MKAQSKQQSDGRKGDVNRRQWKFVCLVEKYYQSRLKQRSLLPMELIPVLILKDLPAELLLGTDFLPELHLLPGGGQTAKDGEIMLQPTTETAVRLLTTTALHNRIVKVTVDEGVSGDGVLLPRAMDTDIGCNPALLTIRTTYSCCLEPGTMAFVLSPCLKEKLWGCWSQLGAVKLLVSNSGRLKSPYKTMMPSLRLRGVLITCLLLQDLLRRGSTDYVRC